MESGFKHFIMESNGNKKEETHIYSKDDSNSYNWIAEIMLKLINQPLRNKNGKQDHWNYN